MKDVAIGASLRKEIVVADEHLACQVGSGNVSVYATPMMLALMEGAAAELLASFLEGDETSVASVVWFSTSFTNIFFFHIKNSRPDAPP